MNDSTVAVMDYAPTTDRIRDDVIAGLGSDPKQLPCKYFYDQRGSLLFEQICELDEYYLTRTELEIMEQYAAEMAATIGPRCMLIEYGSGSSTKTRILLDEIQDPAAYVPVDISRAHLRDSATKLSQQYPELEVLPVCADFTRPFEPPQPELDERRRVVYFPGSTIGNFEPEEAQELLEGISDLVGEGGGLLIGMDLQKDSKVLEAAYNDGEGVTAEFNLNLLERINRELDADFELDCFEHRAQYNEELGRVEIDIVSLEDQSVEVDGVPFEFSSQEAIRTEHSHKYRRDSFREMAEAAGFREVHVWTDERNYFAVSFYECC